MSSLPDEPTYTVEQISLLDYEEIGLEDTPPRSEPTKHVRYMHNNKYVHFTHMTYIIIFLGYRQSGQKYTDREEKLKLLCISHICN